MQLLESKSLLAKLMATENLIIEQKNVQTASFDVKNRILTVPTLNDKVTGYEYDLFMGHEVGHALYTPLNGLYKAKELKLSRNIANIIEDVRIERKIKNKYPGLRSSFSRAYRGLNEKNFFGIKGLDVNSLKFIDRINLYYKIGAGLGIRFSDVEHNLLNEIDAAETYEDVLEVTKKVMAYQKQENEERKKQNENGQNGEDADDSSYDQDDDGDSFEFDEFDDEFGDENDEDEYEYGDEKEMAGSSASNDEREDENADIKSEKEEGQRSLEGGEAEEEFNSFTQREYEKNENKLFADNNREITYVNIPTNFDLNKIIWDYKPFYNQYKKEIVRVKKEFNIVESTMLRPAEFQKFRRQANKIVSYLVKEFEMRKNADQLKRASVAKTGDLNMEKIYAYKFSEDLFKKITVLPGGKSHGLVMFIDWSGSMYDHLLNTIKQLLTLALFCRKVNIPFEVYAFADHKASLHTERFEFPPVDGDLHLGKIKLYNLISSRMSAAEFTYAGSALMQWGNNPRWTPSYMSLSSTPLNEAIVTAMELVPAFQHQYKLQVVNTVFLTDGGANSTTEYWEKNEQGLLSLKTARSNWNLNTNQSVMIRDPKTKNQVLIDDTYNYSEYTSSLIKLLKQRTNCNTIGFYVISQKDFKSEIGNYFPVGCDIDTLKSQFKKDKYMVVTSAGYDEYYLLRAQDLDTDDNAEFEVKENATTRGLVSAFTKYHNNRIHNRVVLNRFIGLIS